jgi:hypothetical protein
MTRVVRAQTAVGDIQGAVATANTVRDPQMRYGVLAQIAMTEVDPGRFGRLAMTMAQIQDPLPYAMTLAVVAAGKARNGGLETARDLSAAAGRSAAAIADWPARAVVSYMVAAVRARIGDARGVALAVEAIGPAAFHATTLHFHEQAWLVEAHARAGNFDQAFGVADAVDPASLRVRALLAMAEALRD